MSAPSVKAGSVPQPAFVQPPFREGTRPDIKQAGNRNIAERFFMDPCDARRQINRLQLPAPGKNTVADTDCPCRKIKSSEGAARKNGGIPKDAANFPQDGANRGAMKERRAFLSGTGKA